MDHGFVGITGWGALFLTRTLFIPENRKFRVARWLLSGAGRGSDGRLLVIWASALTPRGTIIAALLGSVAVGMLPLFPGSSYWVSLVGRPIRRSRLPWRTTLSRPFKASRTSQKEWALNAGRMGGYLIVWCLVLSFPHPVPVLRGLLMSWPALALALSGAIFAVNRSGQTVPPPFKR